MGDNAAQQNKKKKTKWGTPYLAMTIREAEKHLGVRISKLTTVSVQTILANAGHNFEVLDAKEKVYDQIVQYLDVEGYPEDSDPDFKEANISDLVYGIIGPTIQFMRKKTKCMIRLAREKEIVFVDNETGGDERPLGLDLISVAEGRFVFIVEAMQSAFGQAKKQVLLSMKDAGDNNGGGTVYGFITTGERWQMFCYDGKGFCETRKMVALFDGMGENKELWMKDCSVLVDCLVAALSIGGIVERDVVVAREFIVMGVAKSW